MGNAAVSATPAAAPAAAPAQDYSAQWAAYYRSIGKIGEAEQIEAQARLKQVNVNIISLIQIICLSCRSLGVGEKLLETVLTHFFPSFFRVPRVVKDQAREHRLVNMVGIPALDPEVMPLLRLATTVDSPVVANLKAEQLLTAIKVTVAMGNNLPMLDSSRRNQQTSKQTAAVISCARHLSLFLLSLELFLQLPLFIVVCCKLVTIDRVFSSMFT